MKQYKEIIEQADRVISDAWQSGAIAQYSAFVGDIYSYFTFIGNDDERGIIIFEDGKDDANAREFGDLSAAIRKALRRAAK